MRLRDLVKLGALFFPLAALAGTTIIQGSSTKIIQGATTKLIQVSGGGSPSTPPIFVAEGGGSAGSYDNTHTIAVGSEANRLLILTIAIVSSGQAATITGVTFSGVAMTDAGSGLVYDGSGNGLAIYYLIAPANVTDHCVISGDQTGVSSCNTYLVEFSGASQITPIAGHQSATGTGTAVSLTVVSASGQTVYDSAYGAHFFTGTAHANRTINNFFGGTQLSTSYLIPGVSSSVMDWVQSSSGTWVELAINVNGL